MPAAVLSYSHTLQPGLQFFLDSFLFALGVESRRVHKYYSPFTVTIWVGTLDMLDISHIWLQSVPNSQDISSRRCIDELSHSMSRL